MNRTTPFVFAALLAALALSRAARAQAVVELDRPRSVGIELPPTNTAIESSPFSLVLNPAGLVLGPGGLAYLHEDDDPALKNARRGDALFLSLGGLREGETASAALGLSLEWLRPRAACTAADPCWRRTTLGLAFGTPALAFGLDYHWYQSAESTSVDQLGTLDLGVVARPAKWLSLAGTALAINAPQNLSRVGVLALALRPFGPKLTLGAEYWFDGRDGFTHGQLAYDLGVRLFGLDLVGNLAHDVQPVSGKARVALEVALRGGFGDVGVTAGGGGLVAGGNGSTVDVGAEARFAHGPYLFGAPKVQETLDLSEALAGPSRLMKLFFPSRGLDPYLKLVLRLQRLENDPALDTLVVKIDGTGGLSFGRAEELRGLFAALRAHGKHVVAWLSGGGDTAYYLACAADRIYAAPQALFEINGLSISEIYLKGLLDKIGARPEFVKIGKYKSAPEEFTNEAASGPAALQVNAMLDDLSKRYVAAIGRSRHLPTDVVQKALDRGLFVAEEGVKLGFFDGVAAPGEELDDEVTKLAGRRLPEEDLGPASAEPERWGSVPAIALVEVDGDIVGGDEPGFAAADRIVREVRAAARDSSVRAIVLRVESPGGDVAASELIYRAVRRAAKKKPVIASFGDVAASGGYYVGVAADRIVAEPSTITGSIGVFAGKADLSGLFAKIGVSVQTFERGAHADIFTLARPWTPEETKVVQAAVQSFYETFLRHVARGRKMSVQQVDGLARGRVWTGAQAKAKGLVDQLGGLFDALSLARRAAGLSEGAVVTVTGAPGLFSLPPLARPTRPQAPGTVGATALSAFELLAAGAEADPALVARARPLVEALLVGRPLALAVDLPRPR